MRRGNEPTIGQCSSPPRVGRCGPRGLKASPVFRWSKVRTRTGRIGTVALAAIAVAAILTVDQTGGPQSPYLALLFLPIVLAAIRASAAGILAVGAAVALGYLFFLTSLLAAHSIAW